jgi:hypothetical protein
MTKCQYKLLSELGPLATEDEIARIKSACECDRARLGQRSRSYVTRWRIHESQLRGAVVAHVEAGWRIFHKFIQDGTRRVLPCNLEANISLSEDHDIYVEFILMEGEMIIINAHDHSPDIRRLPQ